MDDGSNLPFTFKLPECQYSKIIIQACYQQNIQQIQIILQFLKNLNPDTNNINNNSQKVLVDYDIQLDNEDNDNNDNNNEEEEEEVVNVIENKDNQSQELQADKHQNDDNSLLLCYTEEDLLKLKKALTNNNNDEDNDYDYDWDLSTVINLPADIKDLQTPLHIASQIGNTAIVKLLLLYGADPTKVDSRNRTPYFVCCNKNIRDVYRKIRGAKSAVKDDGVEIIVNENMWDWDRAGVGESITLDKLLVKKEKAKEKKKKSKDKKKAEKIKNENDKLEKLKLLELELKAKEEEKKKISNMLCDSCGKPFTYGIKPLEFNNKKCCSNNCIIALRRLLAAEAALSRIGSKRMVM